MITPINWEPLATQNGTQNYAPCLASLSCHHSPAVPLWTPHLVWSIPKEASCLLGLLQSRCVGFLSSNSNIGTQLGRGKRAQ